VADLRAAYRQLTLLSEKLPVSTQKNGTEQNDEFYTPDCATALIAPHLPKGATIWEAAWGKGHMARSLRKRGYKVVGSPHMNFLTAPVPVCDCIITNPPFSKKDDFLRRAYEIGKPWAFILPADSLFGLERYPLFSEYGLQLLIPNRRIQFLGENDVPIIFNFNTLWCCWRSLPRDVLFADLMN
jgi:hypothetical protein